MTTLGAYLADLLTTVSAYRAKWDDPATARRATSDGLNRSAVAATIGRHVETAGGRARSPSAWKTLVWKAFSDNGCSRDMLDVFIEVFAIDENPIHEHRLRTLHALRYSAVDSRDPIPADRWVPEAILSRVGSLRRHRTVSVHDVHSIGPDRRPVSHWSAQVIEAVADGCDRYYFNYDARAVEVEILAGGRLVEVYETDGGLRCNEVAFGRTIPIGESHRFEILVRFVGDAQLPAQVRRASADRIRSLYLEVVFDPAAIPSGVVWAEWECLDADEPAFTQAVPVSPLGGAHRYVESADRPVVGFTWRW